MKKVVLQKEVVYRRYLVEVPDDKPDDEIEEQFFIEDIGGPRGHFKEDYNVDLEVLDADNVPEGAFVFEMFDEEDGDE